MIPLLLLLQSSPAYPAPARPGAATATPAQPASPAAAPADPLPADWRPIPDDELLVMTLANDRTVVVRLAPRFAPAHVANIARLAAARWWDALDVYRAQENWVVQWGDQSEKKPLPPGASAAVTPEFEIGRFDPAVRMAKSDGYSAVSGISADAWPMASDGKAAWLTHCYGMVGVARDAAPTSGSGAELFTPIGQSARRLDRNYTVVGRVIEGMKYLSAMPRSDAPMGMYATQAERTPIMSVRLASDIAPAQRPHFEYRAADNARFAAMVRLRETPAAPTVATGASVCDVPLATRRAGN